MSRESNSEYYASRAKAERRLSESATDPRVASAHAEFADRYQSLVQGFSRLDPDLPERCRLVAG